MTSVSVTSSVRTSGGRSCARRCLATRSTRLPSANSRPETLMASPMSMPGPTPGRQLGARFGEDEVADLADHAHLLGDPDELLRGDRAVHRVVPAGQRLDLDDRRGTGRRRSAGTSRSARSRSARAWVNRPPSMSQRRMLWSCSTEYTSTMLRRSLARYMAMSARWRSSDTSSPCSGASAMPALAVTASVSPSISIGRDSSALSSLTMAMARSASVTSAMTRANSSPPRRATVACSPTARSRRSETSQRRRSPMAWPSVSLTSLKRSRSSRTMATPPLLVEGVRRPGEEQHAVGEPGEHVVGRLVGLAVDLEAQLLDETGPLEVGACVRHERLEEAEIVVVEAVELLVAVQGDDCSDGRVLVHDRGHDGVDVSPGDRVVAAPVALRGRGRVKGRDPGFDGLGDDRRRVEADRLDP